MSTQYDMWYDNYLGPIKEKANQIKDLLEDCSYLVHVLRGEKISPPLVRANISSVEVIYKNIDIYCYNDTFNIYVDKVSLFTLTKVNVRAFADKWKTEPTNEPTLYNLKIMDISYDDLENAKQVLLNFL